jgi:putative acyl-CoA dehydrogenase
VNDGHATTDEVLNQPPPLEGYDAYAQDPWLKAAVRRAGVSWVDGAAADLGRYVGSAEAQHHAALANRHGPELRTHDRFGHRIDAVEYHPSYHALMQRACGAGVHSLAWKKRDAGGFSARAARSGSWSRIGIDANVMVSGHAVPCSSWFHR